MSFEISGIAPTCGAGRFRRVPLALFLDTWLCLWGAGLYRAKLLFSRTRLPIVSGLHSWCFELVLYRAFTVP